MLLPQASLLQRQDGALQVSLLKATGDALALQGRAVPAAEVYQQALALHPGSPDITLVCSAPLMLAVPVQ